MRMGVFPIVFTKHLNQGLRYFIDPFCNLGGRTRSDAFALSSSAGTLAFTSGAPGALIGVMVAVALMPPLVTCGMLLGEGEWLLSSGAFLLVAANVICVNIAGVATFALQGVRPRTWWEAEKAKKATVKASVIYILLLLALITILIVRYEFI